MTLVSEYLEVITLTGPNQWNILVIRQGSEAVWVSHSCCNKRPRTESLHGLALSWSGAHRPSTAPPGTGQALGRALFLLEDPPRSTCVFAPFLLSRSRPQSLFAAPLHLQSQRGGTVSLPLPLPPPSQKGPCDDSGLVSSSES